MFFCRRDEIVHFHGTDPAPAVGVVDDLPEIAFLQHMAELERIDDIVREFLAAGHEHEITFQPVGGIQVVFVQQMQARHGDGQLERFRIDGFMQPVVAQFPDRFGDRRLAHQFRDGVIVEHKRRRRKAIVDLFGCFGAGLPGVGQQRVPDRGCQRLLARDLHVGQVDICGTGIDEDSRIAFEQVAVLDLFGCKETVLIQMFFYQG